MNDASPPTRDHHRRSTRSSGVRPSTTSSLLLVLAAWVSSSHGISVPTGKVGPITPYRPPPPTPHPGPLRDPAPVVEYSPENPEPAPLDPSYVPYSFKTLSALSGNSIFYIPVRIRNIHQDNVNGFSSYYPQSPETNYVSYKGTYSYDRKPVGFNVPIKELDYAFPKKRPIVVAPLTQQQLQQQEQQQPQQQQQQVPTTYAPQQQQQQQQQNQQQYQPQQQNQQQYQPQQQNQQQYQPQQQNQQQYQPQQQYPVQGAQQNPTAENSVVPQAQQPAPKTQHAYSASKVHDYSHYQKKRNHPKQEHQQQYNVYETTGKPTNGAYPKKAYSAEGLPSKYFYYVKHN